MGMRQDLRRYLNLAIGIALSGVFLYLAFGDQDWGAIAAQLGKAHYWYLLPMAIIGIYALYVRSQRWQLLLDTASAGSVPMGPIFSASAIGFMANMLLPFRVGEFARPMLVSRRTGVSLSTCFATVVVERVFDLVVLFAFALGVVAMADVPEMVKRLTWVAGAVAVGVAGGAYVVSTNIERYLPLLDRFWDMLPEVLGKRIKLLVHEFFEGMATISEPSTLLRALAWSFYIWFVIVIGFSFGFLATGIEVPFIGGGVTVTTIVALAVSIPSAPAFVGQFEWGCMLALEQIFAVPAASAGGYAILVHAAQFTTQVVLGLVFVLREGLSFHEIGAMGSEPPAP